MVTPVEAVRQGFTELLGWTGDDLYPVDFAIASYLSTFLPGRTEKPWGALVGGPGSGKSQILRMFGKHTRTITMSHFTENAFTSSYQDPNNPTADFSLLRALSPQSTPLGKKVLIIHELSTVLQGRPEKANKLLADLRAAFDGTYGIASGNSGQRTYDTGFGLLVASTEVLDEFLRQNQTLGERTVICRTGRNLIDYEVRREVARSAFNTNRLRKEEIEGRLEAAVSSLIDTAINLPQDVEVKVPNDIAERAALLTNLVTSIRTCPLKNSYVSTPEAPTRLPQQIRLWGDARALADARTEWNMEDFRLARRISMDTMPPDHLRLFKQLWRGDPKLALTPLTAMEISHYAKVDYEFAKRQLHQWTILDFVVQSEGEKYALSPRVAADAAYSLYAQD